MLSSFCGKNRLLPPPRGFFANLLLLLPACLILLPACAGPSNSIAAGRSGRTFWGNVPSGPVPPDRVVKVSLQSQSVYVLDGGRVIWAAATNVGKPGHPTPTGTYRVERKLERKRSGSYGFWVNGGRIIATEGGRSPGPGWRYVGYPMPYWVEFLPGYGFHEGYVWPQPHTHGCLRLHGSAAREFYRLVDVGTPVQIRPSQPEDQTIGRQIPRFDDSRLPDPPNDFLISEAVFSRTWD
ncbi:Uncharacterized erfK/srfK family protein (Modular protein) (modular protein) [Methylacidimicrobium sp. AP8]|uniref:L,D-transpeptidase n=1 Tax=Methylacidimicrobium sp. AP8 TaxID=2730359 RepID=UPI0018C0C92D|nr:L,D-transpeptidase [Methylacidimicrobium sp. AP8]CAB4244430.1 Uncharacterized erfK/srfK family protein (Modular protein) (modular protein) [Methylacidimicrobium sp. AP8]